MKTTRENHDKSHVLFSSFKFPNILSRYWFQSISNYPFDIGYVIFIGNSLEIAYIRVTRETIQVGDDHWFVDIVITCFLKLLLNWYSEGIWSRYQLRLCQIRNKLERDSNKISTRIPITPEILSTKLTKI